MAAIAQMNKLRITNPYTHSGWIANPAEQENFAHVRLVQTRDSRW